mgnify:FL=1
MKDKKAKKMKTKKLFTFLFAGLFLLLLFWINYKNVTSKDNFREGDKLPDIFYQTDSINKRIKIDSIRNSVIIVYDTDCDYCEMLLIEINKKINTNNKNYLYFLNTEKAGFNNSFPYKNIKNARNTFLGYIDNEIAHDSLGLKGTPTTFVINPDRILIRKIKGAIKYSIIDRAINKNGNWVPKE